MAKSGKWSDRLGRLFPARGEGGAPRLGEALLEAGLIDAAQLEDALEAQRRKGFRLGYHLVKAGALDEETLGDFLAARYGVPALGEEALRIDTGLLRRAPEELLRRHEAFPLSRTASTLTLAMADPSDRELAQAYEREFDLRVNPVVAPQSVVSKRLADFFALEAIRRETADGAGARELTRFFTELKDYRFQRVLGVGGFGMVCLCWQVSLDRPVAIKTLGRAMLGIEGMAERFQREGKIIARLRHPNIVQVFEMGEAHGQLYIVMEYFEGRPIDAYSEGRDLVERLTALAAVCEALDHAANRGVVHRDIKPGNILAADNGEVKLLDFGVAFHDQPEDERLTRHNVVLGTPRYMAPECFEGAMATTTRSDIYSLGIVAYEILTGHDYSKSRPLPPARPTPTSRPCSARP